MFLAKYRTSFSSHEGPGVPPAKGRACLTSQAPQQSLCCVLEVEGTLILHRADQHAAGGHHVEEQHHGLILMRRVCVKHALCHHVARGLVEDYDMDASALLPGFILEHRGAIHSHIHFASTGVYFHIQHPSGTAASAPRGLQTS